MSEITDAMIGPTAKPDTPEEAISPLYRKMYPETVRQYEERARPRTTNPAATAEEILYGPNAKPPGLKLANAAEADTPAKAKDAPADAKTNAPDAAKIAADAVTLAKDLALDPGDVRSKPFAQAAAELGLDKAGAQKLADLDIRTRTEFWQGQNDKWRAASAAEFQEADFVAARSVVTEYGDQELTDLLNGYGLGNHPAVIRALARAGKALQRR